MEDFWEEERDATTGRELALPYMAPLVLPGINLEHKLGVAHTLNQNNQTHLGRNGLVIFAWIILEGIS